LLPFPWSEAIWPILGSMFMFRLIVYFYDLRHDKNPASSARWRISSCCRTPAFRCSRWSTSRPSGATITTTMPTSSISVGVDWIVRGVIHLLLYRIVYYHLTLAPPRSRPGAALPVSRHELPAVPARVGLFHIVIGMLYLFGFRLPETHNRYLLASSFTDFWRRINIYWKDFMQKVFYYPAVFRLKKLGTTGDRHRHPLRVLPDVVPARVPVVLAARHDAVRAWQDILFWTDPRRCSSSSTPCTR
jgi:hypothetical protein